MNLTNEDSLAKLDEYNQAFLYLENLQPGTDEFIKQESIVNDLWNDLNIHERSQALFNRVENKEAV